MHKIHFIANSKSKSVLAHYKSIYQHEERMEDADFIACIGGDGFLLSSLHRYHKYSIPFYGINTGKEGFLMNDMREDEDLYEILSESNKTTINPLSGDVELNDGTRLQILAFNEISFMRSGAQAAQMELSVNDKVQIDSMLCDGLILSTPMGSTAYNFSAKGPIIPLNTKALVFTPLNSFRPRALRSVLLDYDANILIDILNRKDRPVYIAFDNQSLPKVQSVKIKINENISPILAFRKEASFEQKILKEQFFTETNSKSIIK